jgi:hypothetical protein
MHIYLIEHHLEASN